MFYINPPKGSVALHVLENSVFTRFEYLRLLEDGDTSNFESNSEYMLEYSAPDRIGHFTLRLIAAASKELWAFWAKNEAALLEQRLNDSSVGQVHRLFRSISRNLRIRGADDTPVTIALMKMSKVFLKPEVYNHIIHGNCHDSCKKYECRVPFEGVSDLISKRKVDLRGGSATLACSDWKTALVCLYRNFLEEEKKKIGHPGYLVSSDPRFLYISSRIYDRKLYESPTEGGITASNIDEESNKFPLCMQNLHSILREKHRLGHHARFNYTIYLKECGMKYDDAFNFWREEYTKPHSCDSGCTHSWQNHEKKLLYSIRYMYALTGSRKNYKTPDCTKFCTDVPGIRYEGGCPYKLFERKKLVELMANSIDEWEIEEVLRVSLAETARAACSEFLKFAHDADASERSVFRTPVPASAEYIPNFITEDEERDIIKRARDSPRPKWTQLSRRRLQNWGGIPHAKGMIAERIPEWLGAYVDKIERLNIFTSETPPNHVLINEYLPGQGIMGHSDGPLFHPVVTTISCGSHALLEFTKRLETDREREKTTEPEFSFLLERKSLLILRESLYHDYLHSIAERDGDVITRRGIPNLNLCSGDYNDGDVLKRDTRLSLTIRHVPKTSKFKLKFGK